MNIVTIGALNLDFITAFKKGDKSEMLSWGKDDERVVDDDSWWNLFYTHLHPERLHWISPGGSAANTGAALAALNSRLDVHVFGMLGDDPEASIYSSPDQWHDASLQTWKCKGARTGRAFSYVTSDEGRKIAVAPGCNTLFSADRVRDLPDNIDWLHASSFAHESQNRELARFLAQVRVRNPNLTISFDPGRFLSSERLSNTVTQVLKQVDVLFLKSSELDSIAEIAETGTDSKKRQTGVQTLRNHVGHGLTVVIERLSSGGYSIHRSGHEPHEETFSQFEDVTDDTGAGDVFDAAFINGEIKGYNEDLRSRSIHNILEAHFKAHGRQGFDDFSTAAPVVFASHSRMDLPSVRRFVDMFDQPKDPLFLLNDIDFGEPLETAISEDVRRSDFLAVFVTPDTMDSSWVAREIEWATVERISIVPIVLANVALPTQLENIRRIDVTRGWGDAAEEFRQTIEKMLRRR